MVWREVWDLPYNLGPPVIQSSKVPPPFKPLSIKHLIPWNSSNGEMDEGHVWVWSNIQTTRKQDVSDKEDVG